MRKFQIIQEQKDVNRLTHLSRKVKTLWNHLNTLPPGEIMRDSEKLVPELIESKIVKRLAPYTIQSVIQCYRNFSCENSSPLTKDEKSLGWIPFSDCRIHYVSSEIRFQGKYYKFSGLTEEDAKKKSEKIKYGTFKEQPDKTWTLEVII